MEYTVSVNNLTRFPDYLFHISNSPKKQANILSYLIVIQIEISWQSTTSILFIHRKRFNDIFSSGPNDTFDKPLYQTDSSIIPCSNFNHINSNTFFDEWWCQSICQTKYSSSRKHKKKLLKIIKISIHFLCSCFKIQFLSDTQKNNSNNKNHFIFGNHCDDRSCLIHQQADQSTENIIN